MSLRQAGTAGQVALAALTTVLCLLGIELAFRVVDPPTRAQPVRDTESNELWLVEGVPLWRQRQDVRTRVDQPCRDSNPQALDVVGLGSSILHGVGVDPAQTWAPILRDILAEQGVEACVHNLSAPAYGAAQKQHLLRESLPALPAIRVVIWEVWGTDVMDYRMLGSMAWRMSDLVVDAEGYPNPLALPSPLNRQLFQRSAAWRYTILGLTPAQERPVHDWDSVLAGPVSEAHRVARDNDATLLLLVMPPLDRPFATTADDPKDKLRMRFQAWAEARADQGVVLLSLAELLRDEDVEALRLDPCCHYNADGQRRIAEVLAPAVLDALQPPSR